MGTTDLYAEDFPHGTPEGYELGCRGSACPNHHSEHMTCRDASIRSRSDYGYRQALAAGTATTLRPEAVPQPPKAMTPPVSRPPIPTPPKPVAAPQAPAQPQPDPKPAVVLPENWDRIPHGTLTGYAAGCRRSLPCPATPACADVQTQYARDRAQRKNAPKKATAPKPAPEPQPEEIPVTQPTPKASRSFLASRETPAATGNLDAAVLSESGTLATALPDVANIGSIDVPARTPVKGEVRLTLTDASMAGRLIIQDPVTGAVSDVSVTVGPINPADGTRELLVAIQS